jgi:hypothetical protein
MGIRDDLTPLESRLVECAAAGEELDCVPTGVTTAEFDQIDDWEERKIRAWVLVALCTGKFPSWSVHPRQGLRLRGAYIVGQLDLTRAQLNMCPLAFDTCRFEEGVVLYQAATSDLHFTSCALPSLNGDELNSSASLRLIKTYLHGMSLVGAEFRGEVSVSDVHLITPDGEALNAYGMSARDMLLSNTRVRGELRLEGATLSSQLYCSEGTKLINPDGEALNAYSLNARDVLLSNTHVEGELRLEGATLSGQLSFTEGTKLINLEGRALDAEACQVGRTLFFELGEAAVGEVNLAYAQVGTLADDLDSWPDTYNLVGFSYQSLGSGENLNRRLYWISKSNPFSAHVYTQLAQVYRSSGHEGFARKVAIRREKERTRKAGLSRESRAWNHFLGLTVAYGYQLGGLWCPL